MHPLCSILFTLCLFGCATGSPSTSAIPMERHRPTPSLEHRPADSQGCQSHHKLLLATLTVGDRHKVVTELQRISDRLRRLKEQGDTQQLVACERQVEPTMRKIATNWYVESRPGHPKTYPYTQSALAAVIASFPQASDAANRAYQHAQVSAVILNDWSHLKDAAFVNQELDNWLAIAELYGRAAKLDVKDEIEVSWHREPWKLRERALHARAIALTNAVSPFDETGEAHVRVAAALELFLKMSGKPNAGIQLRAELLRTLSRPRPDRALALWRLSRLSGVGPLSKIAESLLIATLPTMSASERRTWIKRLRALPETAKDRELRECLALLNKSATCPPRYYQWIENPY